jgi:hypothetical protein
MMRVKMLCHSESHFRTPGKKVCLVVDDSAHVAHPVDGEKVYPTSPLEIYVAGPANEEFFRVGASYYIEVTRAEE